MAGFIDNLLGENFGENLLGGLFGTEYLRDFQHASRVFRSDSYSYSPKHKFLFHVTFEINYDLIGLSQAFPEGTNTHFGLAVKTVQLPGYTFDTHVMNQYNRKRIVQTKVKYDDVSITFHDDNANLIRNLWYAYFTYYYKDSTQNASASSQAGLGNDAANIPQFVNQFATNTSAFDYNRRNTYDPSIYGDNEWGFIGQSTNDQITALSNLTGISKAPFFKAINVYGFNQHMFAQYRLLNPTITSFKHDTYDYSSANGTMEHSMTIGYEGVNYYEGGIDGTSTDGQGNAVAGDFGKDLYDTITSPIARPGSTSKILGKFGLVDSAGGVLGDVANGNYWGAILTSGRAYNTFKDVNLGSLATSELKTGALNSLTGTPNRNTLFNFPSLKTPK
jgi:hypothetical protein